WILCHNLFPPLPSSNFSFSADSEVTTPCNHMTEPQDSSLALAYPEPIPLAMAPINSLWHPARPEGSLRGDRRRSNRNIRDYIQASPPPSYLPRVAAKRVA